ncbi:MAG: hypothetical protein U0411_06565 [Thermodesulfovibrionales bacterium]
MKKGVSAVLILFFLSACATSPDSIQSAYVSPLQYKGYDCDQIIEESSRVARRVGELNGSLTRKASNDAVATGVGLVLFWPALLFIKGNGPEAQEFARMKGEYEALEKTAIERKCNTAMMPKIQLQQPEQEKVNISSTVPGI